MLTPEDLAELWTLGTKLEDTESPLPVAIFSELFEYGGAEHNPAAIDGQAVSVDDAVEALDNLIEDLIGFKIGVEDWSPK